jgi:ABC-type multidrug transport system fused ATPase/permease subunit
MAAPGSQVNQKPKDTKKTLTRLLSYIKGSRAILGVIILAVFIGSTLTIAAPKILGDATTEIFTGFHSEAGINFSKIYSILVMVGIMYLVQAVATFLQGRLMTVVSQKVTYKLRNDLKSKMNCVPITFFDKNQSGNLMSIAVNDADNVATTLQQTLAEIVSSVVTVLGMMAVMFVISWQLTLIALLMIPVSFLVMGVMMPKAQKHMKRFLKSQGEQNAIIEECFSGQTVIKSFNAEEKMITKFKVINEDMYKTSWLSHFLGSACMPIMQTIKSVIYVFIAVTGALLVSNGSLPIGDMQAFLIYSALFSTPINKFGMILSELLTAAASAERIFDVLDVEDMPPQKNGYANKQEMSKVAFDHIQFGYSLDKILMKDFNLEVGTGQTIAIVGHTGAGKTTLINLIERFYEINGGAIRFDGVDIRNMKRADLRKRIGMVLQDTWLFSGTIYDNIKYGNEDATDEEIRTAAKAAFVEDFVLKLPDGYNTILNEDVSNISQGQKQLITIARAFVANPEILILDEATSSVDSRTEMLIQKAMKELLKGRTGFVIAHRLSTIYGADNIIVMNEGDIVETGKHADLIQTGGVYADIYNSQFTPVA